METSNPEEWILPNLLDRRAKTQPDKLYAEYPNSPWTYDDGFRSINYGELANAVDCVATFLLEKLGLGQCDILPYIGPNDVRYSALIIGAIKAGYAVCSLVDQ